MAFEIEAVSEIDARVQELMKCTHDYVTKTPKNLFADMLTRSTMDHHLYVSTSPCIDFSIAGRGQGLCVGHSNGYGSLCEWFGGPGTAVICPGLRGNTGSLFVESIRKVVQESPRAKS